MSADTLREAAKVLRERAQAATPGPWSAADEHGLLGPDSWPAWCVSQMRPGYEAMSPTEGYVTDIADVHGDDKSENPNADYIATMHPGVGLALAEWLDAETEHVAGHYCEAHCEYPDGGPRCRAALALARLILGGAS